MNKIITTFLLIFIALSCVKTDDNKTFDALKAGPRSNEKMPTARWAATCKDTDTNLEYWFGGAGGDSKEGYLLTYVFKDNKWVEIITGNPEQNKLINEFKSLELKMRFVYTSISNRYYQSELDSEKKFSLSKRCDDLLSDTLKIEPRILNDLGLQKISNIKRDLMSLSKNIKVSVQVNDVSESRRLYREFVQVRWLIDSHPCPRSYATMTYDPVSKKIILFGGEGVFGTYSDTWLFDPKTNKWEQSKTNLAPSPRCAHGMVSYNGKVYLIGGYSPRGSTGYCTGLWFRLPMDVWEYDVKKDNWILIKKGESKPQSVLFQNRVFATISDDKSKIMWQTDLISYGKKSGELKGEVSIPGVDIGTMELAVKSGSVEIRGSAFDPAYFEKVPVSEEDNKKFADTLKNLPPNKWNFIAQPCTPTNRDWGTTVLDIDRDQLLHWAGGHSSHCGTDVAHFSLKTNRWHIAYTPELPFDQVYGAWNAGPSLSGRPWGIHTYLSYAYDHITKKLFWVGGEKYSQLTAPSGAYIYDPSAYEWSGSGLTFEKGSFRRERHATCTVSTPAGIAVWGDKSGNNTRSGLWIANLISKKFEPIAAIDNKDGETLPPTPYGDSHGMTYDSTRNRVMLFNFKIKDKFKIWTCNLATKKVEVFTPNGSENFPMKVGFPREATYIPEIDMVYIPTGTELFYDCKNNEWLEMPTAKILKKSNRSVPDYNNSCGVEWDGKRKLLWLVQTDGSVYAMRIDLDSARLTSLIKKPEEK